MIESREPIAPLRNTVDAFWPGLRGPRLIEGTDGGIVYLGRLYVPSNCMTELKAGQLVEIGRVKIGKKEWRVFVKREEAEEPPALWLYYGLYYGRSAYIAYVLG